MLRIPSIFKNTFTITTWMKAILFLLFRDRKITFIKIKAEINIKAKHKKDNNISFPISEKEYVSTKASMDSNVTKDKYLKIALIFLFILCFIIEPDKIACYTDANQSRTHIWSVGFEQGVQLFPQENHYQCQSQQLKCHPCVLIVILHSEILSCGIFLYWLDPLTSHCTCNIEFST